MKQNRKHLSALLLSLLLVMSMLLAIGCGGGGGGSTTTTAPETQGGTEGGTEGTEAPGTTEAPYVDPEAYLYEDLPTGDYDGYTFNMIQYDDQGAQFTILMDIEEDDGTLINGALWERSMLVEDRLGVEIELTSFMTTDEVLTAINEDMSTGDCTYELFSNHTSFLATMALNGMAVSYDELTEVNLEKPWWNAGMMDRAVIGDSKVYMGYGYINMSLFDGQCAVFFNQDLIEDYNLPSIYDMVDEHTWTMDNFISICREFAANGENLYGVSCYPYVGAQGLMYAMDVDFFEKNTDGQWEFVGLTDKMYDVYTKIGHMLVDNTVSNTDWATYFDSFGNNESLCLVVNVSSLKYFREHSLLYGVAPFPLYNEEQENYLSFTTNQVQGVCISLNSKDLSRAATILENLAAESYRQLKDVYYDQLINERLLRDEKSKEVLAMIYETPLILPISGIYDVGLAGNIFAFDGGDTDIASKVDGCRDMVLYKLGQFYS